MRNSKRRRNQRVTSYGDTLTWKRDFSNYRKLNVGKAVTNYAAQEAKARELLGPLVQRVTAPYVDDKVLHGEVLGPEDMTVPRIEVAYTVRNEYGDMTGAFNQRIDKVINRLLKGKL